VEIILDLATRPEEAQRCVDFAAEHPGVYAAIGVHPHEASCWSPEAASELRRLAAVDAVVAIGEIGLDYHYNLSPPDSQREAFAAQLKLATELVLPVSIHSREAEEDTLRLLSESDVGRFGGVMHCFTGSDQAARTCLELGLHISFSGIVTFANADRLRQIAAWVPPDRLLLETDAPYLAPVPFRGKRNEPAHVVEVTRAVAALRGSSPEDLGATICRNFEQLFLGKIPAE